MNLGEATAGSERQVLLCREGALVCALPLTTVLETMRTLPLDPIAGMPPFMAGLSVIRGTPVPVVDLAKLLGAEDSKKGRLVLLNVAGRGVALAVESVLGIRALDSGAMQELPHLLQNASAEFVGVVGALDSRLLLVLEGARILPDSVWAALGARGARA